MAVIKETTYFGKFTTRKEVEPHKPTKIDGGGNHWASQKYLGVDYDGDRVCLFDGRDVRHSNDFGERLGYDIPPHKQLVKEQINEKDLHRTRFNGKVETVYRWEPKSA